MESLKKKYSEDILLDNFNRRDASAFNDVYEMYYNELIHFARKLFYCTEVSVDDVVQDLFLTIWESKSKKFDSLLGIKAYIYVCIKNKLKNFITHNKYVDTYNKRMVSDNAFVTNVAESEMLSVISQAIDLLPEECSRVFQLHLDGWDVKDIAEKLNKSESTVYKQKHRAIDILKGKMYSQLSLILTLMN